MHRYKTIEIPYEYVIAAKRSRQIVRMFEEMDPMDQTQQLLSGSDMALTYEKAKKYLREYQDQYYS